MDATATTSQATEAPQAAPARAPRKPPIEMTAKAAEMVKKALDEQNQQGLGLQFLRVGVVGGGCSGFSYDLDLVKESKPTDFKFEIEGLSVCIDPMSAQYLKGTAIDYYEDPTNPMRAGFKFNNPSAKHTCGCGSSFSA
jgi:iron-sulfur cluster assembly accessory protein